MKLSQYFSLEEFLRSDTAKNNPNLLRLQNNPPDYVKSNLSKLALTLDKIRNALEVPIIITSGYRCSILNVIVGGEQYSAHMDGLAADCQMSKDFIKSRRYNFARKLVSNGFRQEYNPSDNFYLFAYAALNMKRLRIDKVIHENGRIGAPGWVHIAISDNPQNIALIKHAGKKEYEIFNIESLKG